jgi:hypothetical protein
VIALAALSFETRRSALLRMGAENGRVAAQSFGCYRPFAEKIPQEQRFERA